jgi:hypothetical protein
LQIWGIRVAAPSKRVILEPSVTFSGESNTGAPSGASFYQPRTDMKFIATLLLSGLMSATASAADCNRAAGDACPGSTSFKDILLGLAIYGAMIGIGLLFVKIRDWAYYRVNRPYKRLDNLD